MKTTYSNFSLNQSLWFQQQLLIGIPSASLPRSLLAGQERGTSQAEVPVLTKSLKRGTAVHIYLKGSLVEGREKLYSLLKAYCGTDRYTTLDFTSLPQNETQNKSHRKTKTPLNTSK